jgi:Txe/YoeB family toxin of Txe-Axe toxin-antitoxin module
LFSRRIDRKNRLVYSVDENKDIAVLWCKGHYED